MRDAFLGKLGDDLDFATNAHPDETLRILEGWAEAIWTTGVEFGTIGAARATDSGWRSPRSGPRRTTGVSRNPIVKYGTNLARRSPSARLHDQRDGCLRAGACLL